MNLNVILDHEIAAVVEVVERRTIDFLRDELKFSVGSISRRLLHEESVELREMTKKLFTLESNVMMSSHIPSAKNSCSGSPLRLMNGRTAIDGLSLASLEIGHIRAVVAASVGRPTRNA